MRLNLRVARLERRCGGSACATCNGQPGLRFVLPWEEPDRPERCPACGAEALTIRIVAAEIPQCMDGVRNDSRT